MPDNKMPKYPETFSQNDTGQNAANANLTKYEYLLVGIISCLIHGKEGGIQVLAGLAPSSQTVGSNKERTGATKGGS